MSFLELVRNNRSCRRFEQSAKLDKNLLKELSKQELIKLEGSEIELLDIEKLRQLISL